LKSTSDVYYRVKTKTENVTNSTGHLHWPATIHAPIQFLGEASIRRPSVELLQLLLALITMMNRAHKTPPAAVRQRSINDIARV